MTALLAQIGPLQKIATPSVEWLAVAPELVLIGGALILLLAGALRRKPLPPGSPALITMVVAGLALVAAGRQWNQVRTEGPRLALADALAVDGFSVFFMVLVCATIALAALVFDGYLRREGMEGSDPYVLTLLSGSGAMFMAAANDLVVLFLGLEVLSIALYILAASHLGRPESQEAGMKYFVLGAFSSAFFLYGIALVYGATGSTNLGEISAFLSANTLANNGVLLGGIGFLVVGLGFKVAAVPFHMWTPDVYQGSPTPVTGFMAAAAKAAGFAGLLRVLISTFGLYQREWEPVVWVLAALTLVVGSVLALVQTDIKRMLAYSSISHAGYVLVGLQAASDRGLAGALFYLLTYTFMILGSFGVVTLVGRRGDAAHDLDAYRGLGSRRPGLALTFTVFLLAQAGVPLTSGFLAKFYVISAVVEQGSYALAIIAMGSAVIAAFFYLRVIVVMYMTGEKAGEAEANADPARRIPVPVAAGAALAAALVFTLVVGILPGAVIDFARQATLLVS